MNQPDRYSRFVLPSGVEQAVEYKQDTKMRAAGQFNIWLQDHTLGNLARHQLLSNPEVVFAGYRIPHPLTPMMVVRIQTTEQSDPPSAMLKAIEQLSAEVGHIREQLQACAPRDVPQQDQQQAPPQYGGGYDPYAGGAAPGGGYGAPPAGGYGGGAGGYQQPPPGGAGGYGY